MPRAKALCGTYSAYKRHKRDGEPVDELCRQASVERSREQTRSRQAAEPDAPVREPAPEPPAAGRTRKASLEWNLALIEAAMAEVEPSKLSPLSKRHSELLAELAALDGGGEKKEADPFDDFFAGGADFSNVARFPAPADREAS